MRYKIAHSTFQFAELQEGIDIVNECGLLETKYLNLLAIIEAEKAQEILEGWRIGYSPEHPYFFGLI